MHNQPYVGRIALCTRKKLLKNGEIRHFYVTVYNVHSTHCLYVHYTLSVHTYMFKITMILVCTISIGKVFNRVLNFISVSSVLMYNSV